MCSRLKIGVLVKVCALSKRLDSAPLAFYFHCKKSQKLDAPLCYLFINICHIWLRFFD
jgi:hypothetical protein